MADEKHEADVIENDGATFFHPRDYFNWIARQQYQKRNKGDPLWVSCVVTGINKKTNEVFLGSTDYLGTKIEDNFVVTGIGHHYT